MTEQPEIDQLEELENEPGNEVDELRAERDDLMDQLQRSRADFVNFKRRTDQERFMVREMIGKDILAQFLPVLDDFERALGALPDSERENKWVSGMELVQQKLQGILERAGVARIEALHQAFDPKEHEAVATEPGTSGTHIVEVYQPGYKIGETLLRPAMVKTGDPVTESEFNA